MSNNPFGDFKIPVSPLSEEQTKALKEAYKNIPLWDVHVKDAFTVGAITQAEVDKWNEQKAQLTKLYNTYGNRYK